MGRREIIELAMQLKPAERFEVAEELLRSVEEVDRKSIDSGLRRRSAGSPLIGPARSRAFPPKTSSAPSDAGDFFTRGADRIR
jgi:hypothetical protein